MSESEPPAEPRPGETTLQFLGGLLRDWGFALAVVVLLTMGYSLIFSPSVPSLGPAPDFSLVDLDGDVTQLSGVSADVVVLNFWFVNCPPCREEIPELSAFAAAHPNVALLGINTDGHLPRKRLQAASSSLGVAYPVLHDVREDVARMYGISNYPTTVVIHDMQVVASRVGMVDRDDLERMVAAAH